VRISTGIPDVLTRVSTIVSFLPGKFPDITSIGPQSLSCSLFSINDSSFILPSDAVYSKY
jgi:hypothetical protein